MSHIKSLLPEDDTPHFAISNSCEPSPIKVVHQDTTSKSGFPARSLLLAATSRISSFLNILFSGSRSQSTNPTLKEKQKEPDDQQNKCAASSVSNLGGQCSDLTSITQDRNVPLASTPIIQQETVSKNNHPDTQTSATLRLRRKKYLNYFNVTRPPQ